VLLAYLGGGEYGGRRLIAESTVGEMLEPRVVFAEGQAGRGTMVGLGWFLGNLNNDAAWFGHSGLHMWGWTNLYRAYPKLDLAVVVSTNRWDLGVISSWSGNLPVTQLIAEVAADFVADRLQGRDRETQRSWAWKRSYTIGLCFAAEALFRLGISEPINDETAGTLITGGEPGANAGV